MVAILEEAAESKKLVDWLIVCFSELIEDSRFTRSKGV